MVGVVKQ